MAVDGSVERGLSSVGELWLWRAIMVAKIDIA